MALSDITSKSSQSIVIAYSYKYNTKPSQQYRPLLYQIAIHFRKINMYASTHRIANRPVNLIREAGAATRFIYEKKKCRNSLVFLFTRPLHFVVEHWGSDVDKSKGIIIANVQLYLSR